MPNNEIERLIQSICNEMFPRKSFPVSHCDILRNALSEMRTIALREAADLAKRHAEVNEGYAAKFKDACDSQGQREANLCAGVGRTIAKNIEAAIEH